MDTKKKQDPKAGPGMDAVLLRMLNTPPTPFTPPAKAAKKTKDNKPVKPG